MREGYLKAHPNNLVRILRPLDMPVPEGRSPYAEAARLWQEWRREGIVERTSEPALFAYHQRFRVPGGSQTLTRKGAVVLTRLESYDRRVVFPHERTLSGPREDRLELLRHTRTHFGQVFLAYSDPREGIDALLDEANAEEVTGVVDEFGVEHRIWPVTAPGIVQAVAGDLAGRSLLIADGHHRYETALAFRDEERERNGGDAGPFEWLMTTLVNMDSPGMVVLPTHRLLHGLAGFEPRRLLEQAEALFEVRDVSDPGRLPEQVEAGRGQRPTIGLAYRGAARLLVLREAASPPALLPDLDPRQASLDVVILHRLVLERMLGLDEEAIRRESHIHYLRDASQALMEVGSGNADAAFLLNPTPLAQVREIAFDGGVLPQKSTDFFPKLLSGLVMYAPE
jgi:uncharacterized protein (DUF1015 family)